MSPRVRDWRPRAFKTMPRRRAPRRSAASSDDPGSSIADFSVTALAFIFASALTVLVAIRVDETDLVVAAGAVATMVLWLVKWAAHAWFKNDDGRIDAGERYGLYILIFFGWLGYYFTAASAVVLFYELTRAWPLPRLSEMLLYLAILLVSVVALVPRFSALVVADTPRSHNPRSPAARDDDE